MVGINIYGVVVTVNGGTADINIPFNLSATNPTTNSSTYALLTIDGISIDIDTFQNQKAFHKKSRDMLKMEVWGVCLQS